jgi:hypothetical protein
MCLKKWLLISFPLSFKRPNFISTLSKNYFSLLSKTLLKFVWFSLHIHSFIIGFVSLKEGQTSSVVCLLYVVCCVLLFAFQQALVRVAVWCLGEFGELLVNTKSSTSLTPSSSNDEDSVESIKVQQFSFCFFPFLSLSFSPLLLIRLIQFSCMYSHAL